VEDIIQHKENTLSKAESTAVSEKVIDFQLRGDLQGASQVSHNASFFT
jgi:hypothetical protein